MDLSKLYQYIPIIAVNFKLDTCKDHYDSNQARCFPRANYLFVTRQNMFCVSFKKDVFLGKLQKPNRTLVLRIILNSPTPHSVGNWVCILLMKKKFEKTNSWKSRTLLFVHLSKKVTSGCNLILLYFFVARFIQCTKRIAKDVPTFKVQRLPARF